jgi:hypothetical protein
MQEDPTLAQGGAKKYDIRAHPSWVSGKDIDANGNPVYATLTAADSTGNAPNYNSPNWGMSWFPGYAINEETGERLNIVFSEDSWLNYANGSDLLWNPTSTVVSSVAGFDVNVIFGGKHFVYVLGTRYDSCNEFKKNINSLFSSGKNNAWKMVQWAGVPLLNGTANISYLPLSKGFVPTGARLRFRVNRPYAFFNPSRIVKSISRVQPLNPATFPSLPTTADSAKLPNYGFPYYTFSTTGLAKTAVTDKTDKGALLNRIYVVPNPYYAHSGYETNRFDTKVKIINLPAQATISIYSLDGSLIRILTKSDPNVSYIDWDIRNSVGLPVSSGMYLMHVNCPGIGETILRWFGGTRPIDITTY